MMAFIKTLTPIGRIVIAIVLLIVIIAVLAMLSQCGGNRQAVEQAKQTNRSGQAITAAASDAIETIGDRVATENNIDDAVTDATKDIADAQDPNAIRDVVVRELCKQNSHRLDPACRVR